MSTHKADADGLETVPAFECHEDCPVAALDAQAGERTSGSRKAGTYRGLGYMGSEADEFPEIQGSTGGASRYFYCPKASRADRNEGLEGMTNGHPTVKSTDLMRWLCRLITPEGGTILDPFCGSGSTGKAAALEGFGFVGIERDPEYYRIAERRIDAARRELPLFSA